MPTRCTQRGRVAKSKDDPGKLAPNGAQIIRSKNFSVSSSDLPDITAGESGRENLDKVFQTNTKDFSVFLKSGELFLWPSPSLPCFGQSGPRTTRYSVLVAESSVLICCLKAARPLLKSFVPQDKLSAPSAQRSSWAMCKLTLRFDKFIDEFFR